MKKTHDQHLLDQLVKAYTARAKLFHSSLKAANIDLLISEIDDTAADSLRWPLQSLGISNPAMTRLKAAGASPHQVFAHPDLISKRPYLIAYYRNIATISKKGVSQVLFSVESYESRKRGEMDRDLALQLCRMFNKILSGVIEDTTDYDVGLSRQSLFAEIGTELQGSWTNTLGTGAAKKVREILLDHVVANETGIEIRGVIELRHGWRIVFASEPDVSFFDKGGTRRIAIEIKGSLDRAGAQTRYGEAKKSFSKVLKENPRCHTIYLASCYTDAVVEQIKADGQVRDWFNLTSIVYDDRERASFLGKLFHLVRAPD
jgi:hypothetical protein